MKHVFFSAAAVAASVVFANPAAAAVFAGGAKGCFAVSPSTTCTTTATSSDSGLTFLGGTATFNQSTNSSGFAAIGGPTNNFGTITLAPSTHDYTKDLFKLLVTFALPVGTSSGSFTSDLMGSLTSNGTGGVDIHFLNPTRTIATAGGGTLILHVNDVAFSGSLPFGETLLRQNISGYIKAAVPEPSTWAMMLLGFGAMGLAIRRRGKPTLAQIA